MKWKGFGDSRPEASKPKAGKLDCTGEAKKFSRIPVGSEAFGDRVGGKSVNWKGQKDSRP